MERQVGLVREQFFTPRLAAKDFVELNEILREKCLEQAQTRRHPTQQDKLIMEVFAEERRHLLAVPRPFDGYAADEARVSRTSLVRYDRNHYSVPVSEVGRTVTVRAYADKIKIISQGKAIAFYDRQFGRGKTMFDPWHYLPVLQRKPGALRNGAPFQHWDLPPELTRMREALSRFSDWDRQFVAILCAVPQYGLLAVADACGRALAANTVSKDVVLSLLSQEGKRPEEAVVVLPQKLMLNQEPVADCSRYDKLLQETRHVA